MLSGYFNIGSVAVKCCADITMAVLKLWHLSCPSYQQFSSRSAVKCCCKVRKPLQHLGSLYCVKYRITAVVVLWNAFVTWTQKVRKVPQGYSRTAFWLLLIAVVTMESFFFFKSLLCPVLQPLSFWNAVKCLQVQLNAVVTSESGFYLLKLVQLSIWNAVKCC